MVVILLSAYLYYTQTNVVELIVTTKTISVDGKDIKVNTVI